MTHLQHQNDCDCTRVVRPEIDSDVMDTVDPGQVHPPCCSTI